MYNLTQGTRTPEPCRGDDITVHLSGGDITAVTAGTGLTGGGSEGAVTLAVDPSIVQSRINGICPPGSSIRMVNQDGTVTCETSGGDITSVTVGHGLTGGGTRGDVNVSVNPNVIQNRVQGQCFGGMAIRAVQQDGNVACQAEVGDISAVTAGTGLTGGGDTGSISLSVDTTAVQSRVTGQCNAGSAVRIVHPDGTVTCQGAAPTYLNDTETLLGTALDLSTRPVVCRSQAHTPASATVARIDSWASLEGTGPMTFSVENVVSTDAGVTWFSLDTVFGRDSTAQAGQWGHATNSSLRNLFAGTTYHFGVRLGRDGGTANPIGGRCEVMVEIG